MKKNLLLRLCLIITVSFIIYSCRTDHLPEQETFNNSSAFQLTSKRISLSESKHKEKLVTELGKAEANFKILSTAKAKGRVIDYGNGVSIDTDHVTYIENGPNFHTYTFHLTHENALPADPVENLVLIPTTNGTYRELLVSYHLTPQEKQALINGGHVDTKGKTTVTVLDGNTYNPLNAKSGQSCVWLQAVVGYTPCGANQHFSGEGGDTCKDDLKSQPIREFFLKCTNISAGTETGGGWWAGEGGGPDNGGGGTQEPGAGTAEPCNGNGVATGPLDPSTNIGEGGCSGIPTVVTVPTINRPCTKLSQTTTNPKFASSQTALKGKTGLFRETGYTLSDPLAGSSQTGTQDTFLDSPIGSQSVRFTFNPNTFAFMHVHYDQLKDPIFSPGDIIRFNEWLVWAQNWNSIPTNMPKIDLKRLSYTVVTSLGVYTMTFDGTDVAPFANYDINTINDKYIENLRKATTQTFNGEINFDMDKLEEEFLKFAKDYLPMPGMKLFKIENSGNSEIFLKPNNRRDIVPCN